MPTTTGVAAAAGKGPVLRGAGPPSTGGLAAFRKRRTEVDDDCDAPRKAAARQLPDGAREG